MEASIREWIELAGKLRKEGKTEYVLGKQQYSGWGDPDLEIMYYIEVKRSIIGRKGKTYKTYFGITVKRMGVPESQRRKGVATRLAQLGHDQCMMQGLDFIQFDNVSEEGRKLLQHLYDEYEEKDEDVILWL